MNALLETSLLPADPAAGARNLLVDCMNLQAGDTLLIVAEPDGLGHYEAALAPFLAEQATALGADVTTVVVAPGRGPEDVPKALFDAIERASHTLFLNRLGDQLRFSPLPGAGRKAITYTLDLGYLGSAFGVAAYDALEELRRRVVDVIAQSQRYTIHCPLGTSLSMHSETAFSALADSTGFSVDNFPVMIVPPIPADTLSGKLVLTLALTSTGVHDYADSTMPLHSPIELQLDNGRIVGVQGEPTLAAAVTAHLDSVDARFGGNGRRLGSWHAGINPFTYFLHPALADLERWNGVAFGSPRYAHFHLCGALPGDICGQLFDASIAFDDTVLWDRGRLAFLDAPANADIRQRLRECHSGDAPLPIGI